MAKFTDQLIILVITTLITGFFIIISTALYNFAKNIPDKHLKSDIFRCIIDANVTINGNYYCNDNYYICDTKCININGCANVIDTCTRYYTEKRIYFYTWLGALIPNITLIIFNPLIIVFLPVLISKIKKKYISKTDHLDDHNHDKPESEKVEFDIDDSVIHVVRLEED